MDGHGDYSPLDRQRLIASGLDGGAGGNGVPSNGGGGVHPTVSELAARAPTPTALTTLAQYHSRYGLPPAMSGSNYAIMTSFLSGGHSPDTRKTILPPELQHYWSAHSESFPRYLMTGSLYPPYPPLFPGSAESLSLLGGPGAAPTHHAQYQRFMELQKDAYLASMSAAAAANHHPALYGLPPGGIPPFLEQQQSTSHGPTSLGATPLSLVKQEPKELSCTEKASKQSERRSMGFKVDLDYNRSGKDILSGSHLKEPKLSPSTSMGSPGKHDKKGSGGATGSSSNLNASHGLHKSLSNPSLNPTPRHQQEHLQAKCTSPRNAAASSPPKGRVVNSPNIAANPRKTKSSSHTSRPSKAQQLSERSHSSTLSSVSPAESPIASVPTQAAAPIPLATVQHDGILLSALASPSSAAASSASTKPCTIKQQSERPGRASTGVREHGPPGQDTGLSDRASSSDAQLDVSAERSAIDSNAQEDSCDIVVDSTEHDEVPAPERALSTKSEHDRAIEETIDQVASATDSDTETAQYGAPSQSAVKPLSDPVSSACTVTRTDIRCIVTSSVSSGGTRTVYAKTQPVPSVTATGAVHTMSTLTAPASALPYYHTLYSKPQGVKRVHATTYVPEVGIFKGPSIKSLAKNCLSPLSSSSSTSLSTTASLEDRCRFDSRSLHLNLTSDGRLRTRDNTPSPSRDLSHVSSGTAHSGLEVSSLDTTSLDSVSVRSQSVASVRSQSVASVRSPSVASVHSGLGRDDSSDDEMNGLVIDDEAEDTGPETEVEESCEDVPSERAEDVDRVGVDRIDADEVKSPVDIVLSGPETSNIRTCDGKLAASKTPLNSMKSSKKLNSKVPSDRGDKLFCDEAIDYSLPKNEMSTSLTRTLENASRVSGPTSRTSSADNYFSSLVNTAFSSEKIGRDTQKKTHGGSNSFPKSGVPSTSSNSKLNRSFMNNLPSHEISRVNSKNSSSPSSGNNRKVTTLTHYSDKLVPAASVRRDHVTKRVFREDTVMTTRCDSAPPISGSTNPLPGASKFHPPSLKLGTELAEKFDSSCEHTLGNNIPVGIAVAQIRPHHIQQPRDPQSQETNSHDIRHTHTSSSVKTNNQTTQATPAGSLPPNLVVTGHGVNPSPWLTQVPFTIHTPGATFDPSHYPITPPPGFKFAQDSITGQIFIVPNGVDAGGVWPRANFATPTGAGHPHFQTTINLPTITVNSSEDKPVRSKEESQPDATSPHESLSDKFIPSLAIADVGKQQAIAQALKGNSSGKGNPAPSITSATAATVLVNPVTGISSASPFVDIKTGQTTVQSRGCSPIIFEDDSDSLTLLSTLSSLKAHRPSTSSVSVQTCDALMKQNHESAPVKTPMLDQGVQTATVDLPSLNPLSVQCPDLDSVDNITSALEIKANPDRSSYNPFTDPQILQAADGLELLSTLAEKRPKCSSLDDPKRIFPSPSDSFKSDTASIVAMDETLSPGDTDLKSGQCTPRRDVRRELSPKWTLPKKESQTMTFGDFKTPPEMALDAHEVRVKMAEVQRQYKEKQKKLAKLQSKKIDEGKQSSNNKRGPGRPPKKKSSKSDDDSSSSSSKTKEQHQHHHQHHQPKKKRPAEELVDRVFRKLPPVKTSKVSRSIHYVKSKTGPFFKRKSASSSVKKNKDLFGFDESNWPSFSERKHQEKVKVSGNVSDKSKSRHRSSSSQSEDSKHSHDTGNIFSNFESYSGEYSDRRSRPAKGWDAKLTSHSMLTVKTEPTSFHSTQESGLGLLAKFALTTSTTLLSSSPSSTSSPLLTPTLATTSSGGIHTTAATSQLSTTSFNTNISSSSIYGSGLYSNIYGLTSSIAPTITFGSRSSLMSSPHSSLMSFSTTSLSGTKLTALQPAPTTAAASPVAQPTSSTAVTAVSSQTSLTSPLSQLAGNATGQPTVLSPLSSNLSLSIEDSTSGTTCASDCSPVKRRHDDDSDTDASESSPNKKRKPGRPRKINPDKSSGGTETIWAKKSNSFGLLQVPEPISVGIKEGESKKLDMNVMKPLFLDEEWTRRRSERIFLSETSPQPSPALSPSPRGEPVWKLSNFMPKSKKVLDVNKSLKDNEKDGDKGKEPNLSVPGAAQLKPVAASTPILATSLTSSISIKTEEKEVSMPTLSAFSWTSTTKLSEPSVIKSLEGETKNEHSAFSGQKTKKQSKNRDPDKSKDKEKRKDADKSKDKETDKSKDKEQHKEVDKSKDKEQHKEVDKSKDKEKIKEADKSKEKEKHKEIDKSKDKEKSKEADKDTQTDKDKETENQPSNKPKTKKKVQPKEEIPESSPPSSPLPPLIMKEKRAEEHSKIKLQKAKSLHDLTQRVKKKYSKASNKKQDDQSKAKAKKGKKKRNSSIDSSDTDNLPLSLFRDGPPTPEPRSCKLQTTDLREGLKVLYLNDGLFYEGTVKALQPPDVYGVLTAGQRGSRPHILCQEEVLKDAVLDVRPGSLRYLPEGTRICAFWSQQFSCLYPGTVVKSSPSPHSSASVSVDFDDGDSGRIPIDHIRLLPSDFPIVEYEPDPLENLPKRRRRTTSDASDVRKRTSKTGRNDKRNKNEEDEEEEVEDDEEEEDDDDEINEKDSGSANQTSEKFWGWAGKSTKRPGLKGKAKKIFYRSISRGKEVITVGDSAVFVSTGRANCPYIGHIKSLWEGWAGQMMVKVQWYYHPEETHSDKKLSDPRNALFESHHQDENDVQTISHKCLVLPIAQFKKRLSEATRRGKTLGPNLFYVAGFYEPSFKELSFYPGVS